MRSLLLPIVAMIGLSSCGTVESESSTNMPIALMSWTDLLSRERPEPTLSLTYGAGETDIVDLWVPEGPGPHPVVLMVHGGCWQKAIADRTLMNYAAEDLRQRGFAVWNIEYRGVDEEGGGYPGTFLDVARATKHLYETGSDYGLDTERIVAFGHSAGGHLVSWLATQTNLPEGSALDTDLEPFFQAVINSGGLADLKASEPVTLQGCLGAIMDELTGMADPNSLDRLADTSPAEMLPPTAPIISVNGDQDRIAPPLLGEGFTMKILKAGGSAEYVEIPRTGHVELVSPGTDAFTVQAELMERYLSDK